MPKQGSRAEVNTFVRGLITEASPLNFPANASLDEVNFELKRDGTRRRRLGMAVESGSSFRSVPNLSSDSTTNTYVWSGVNGDYSLEFLVVQIGNVLEFFNTNLKPTINQIIGSVTLPFSPNVRYSFASINGRLVVAGGSVSFYSIEYNNGTFKSTSRNLKVRDVWGIQESDVPTEADDTFQPITLTETHKYNLQNQSWAIPRKNKEGVLVDPVAYYFADLTKYPSSSETVWNGLQFQPVETNRTETPGEATSTTTGNSGSGDTTSTTVVDPATGEYTTTTSVAPNTAVDILTSIVTKSPTVDVKYNDPYERMFNSLYVDRLGANLKAAKGFYVIELLNRGASRLAATTANHDKYPTITAASGFKGDSNTSGASVVCEFAGRIFYSGFDGVVVDGDARSPSLADYVVFSKLVQNDQDIDQCYQEGDPTSRESNEVVDTDGGFISISGAKRIVALHNIGSKLIVLASNGVWSIAGGNDYGFTATNYKVDKLSTFGCVSPESVVIEGSNLLYWGKNAIYAVVPDQVGGFTVQDITADSIQTLYNGIPDSGKSTSVGEYDPVEKKMRWIYRYNSLCKELVFDVVLKCFYQHQIDNSLYKVVGMFYSPVLSVQIKYLTITQNSYAFSTYSNTQFSDWGRVDAKAYLLTGATTAGDSAIDKQVPYVTVHMLRTETGVDANGVPLNQSSCMMSGRWEWATDVVSHRISGLHEVYKYRLPQFAIPNGTFNNGFQTIISKNKVRGKGKAISLYFETSPGKDCQLLGWSLTINGNGIT